MRRIPNMPLDQYDGPALYDAPPVDPHEMDLAVPPAPMSGDDAELAELERLAEEVRLAPPAWLDTDWDDDDQPVLPELVPVEDGAPLLYPGESHLLFGPGGSGKSTLLAWMCRQVVSEQRRPVLIVDYESNRRTWRQRLKALGVSREQAGLIAYWRVSGPLIERRRQMLLIWCDRYQPMLVGIDSVAKSMTAMSLRENENSDVHVWDNEVVIPLIRRNHTVVLIDHVGKPRDDRGGAADLYARGGSAKIDIVSGAAYRFDATLHWTREQSGSARLMTAKDREGARAVGSLAAVMDVVPSDGGARIDVRLHLPDEAPVRGEAGWMPTGLMEQVSKFLEAQSEPVARNRVRERVKGKVQYVLEAIDALVEHGFVEETSGARGARLLRSVRPYREGDDLPGDDDGHAMNPMSPSEAPF